MHSSTRARRALGAAALTVAATAALASQAFGHARIYPNTVAKGEGSAYTLVVPNESEDSPITEVSLEVPEGVLLGGLITEGGWKHKTESSGEGHEATISKVTWNGGEAPVGEAAYFRFTARPDEDHGGDLSEYKFVVTETYADGSVSEWSGPEDSDEPAPVVKVVATAAGGDDTAAAASSDDGDDDGGSNVLSIVALALAAVALAAALAARRGPSKRPLT
jgi:uncharacterized protein YcnI